MYLVVWEYSVAEPCRAEFERTYGGKGDWVQLFQKADGFLGSELYRDEKALHRYITIDRWVSQVAYEQFMHEHQAEYKALDQLCEQLTENQTRIGGFTRT
jgi:heme-degrading monooxygenase HmoA